jgi:hypothetical protein
MRCTRLVATKAHGAHTTIFFAFHDMDHLRRK